MINYIYIFYFETEIQNLFLLKLFIYLYNFSSFFFLYPSFSFPTHSTPFRPLPVQVSRDGPMAARAFDLAMEPLLATTRLPSCCNYFIIIYLVLKLYYYVLGSGLYTAVDFFLFFLFSFSFYLFLPVFPQELVRKRYNKN